MKQSIIPWQIFWEGVNRHSAAKSDAWLSRWKFADAGVLRSNGGAATNPNPPSITKTREADARQNTIKFESLALVSLRLASAFAVGAKPKTRGIC